MGRRTNYERGADKERRIVNRFKKRDWVALRSAGSHSPIDVIAIDPKEKEIKLIQSKLGYLAPSQVTKILKDGEKLNGNYKVVFELWD